MSNIRIGITEQGDGGLDLSWTRKIDTVDGVIVVTKNITSVLATTLLRLNGLGHKIILHCGCTGWGSTSIEPCVPTYHRQLESLRELINQGFPKDHCVLRIDPIFPTPNGLKRVTEVVAYANQLGLLPIRVRFSILDEYKHVKERFRQMGFQPIYGDSFTAPAPMMRDAVETLRGLNATYGLVFEACAEASLDAPFIKHTGCVSARDLELFNLPIPQMPINGQNRHGCLCLTAKTELLTQKRQCPHRCAYCYWRNT